MFSSINDSSKKGQRCDEPKKSLTYRTTVQTENTWIFHKCIYNCSHRQVSSPMCILYVIYVSMEWNETHDSLCMPKIPLHMVVFPCNVIVCHRTPSEQQFEILSMMCRRNGAPRKSKIYTPFSLDVFATIWRCRFDSRKEGVCWRAVSHSNRAKAWNLPNTRATWSNDDDDDCRLGRLGFAYNVPKTMRHTADVKDSPSRRRDTLKRPLTPTAT